jgi:hypothetical protein
LNGLQAVGRTAIIPDLVRMQTLPAVQQPCSNPSKYPEMSRNVFKAKYVYLQVFYKLQKPLENYRAAFTRQRPLVRSQHRPLAKSSVLQVYTEAQDKARIDLGTFVQQRESAATHLTW